MATFVRVQSVDYNLDHITKIETILPKKQIILTMTHGKELIEFHDHQGVDVVVEAYKRLRGLSTEDIKFRVDVMENGFKGNLPVDTPKDIGDSPHYRGESESLQELI